MSPAVAVQTVYPFAPGLRPPVSPADLISSEAVRDQVRRILLSRTFARSPRISRFLTFAAEQTLRGQPETLKEYILGIEVFGRHESFDPRIDSIVRVEARRLRYKLQKYYETEGLSDLVYINFRKGCYVPQFLAKQAGEPAQDGTFDFPYLDPIENARAFALYVRGLQHLHQWSPAGIEKSIALLTEASEMDLECGGAREALAGAWMLSGLLGVAPSNDAIERARTYAADAAAAKPDSAEARVILGFIHAVQDLHWSGVESELRAAIRLNPTSAQVRLWYGVYALLSGHLETACRQLQTAQQAAPGSVAAHLAAGLACHLTGAFEAAVENYRLAREISPALWAPHFAAGLLLADQGLDDQAHHALLRADELDPSNPWVLAALAYNHGKFGRTGAAAHTADLLIGIAAKRYVSPLALCMAHCAAGDREQSLEQLRASYEERSLWLPLVRRLAGFAAVKSAATPLLELLGC